MDNQRIYMKADEAVVAKRLARLHKWELIPEVWLNRIVKSHRLGELEKICEITKAESINKLQKILGIFGIVLSGIAVVFLVPFSLHTLAGNAVSYNDQVWVLFELCIFLVGVILAVKNFVFFEESPLAKAGSIELSDNLNWLCGVFECDLDCVFMKFDDHVKVILMEFFERASKSIKNQNNWNFVETTEAPLRVYVGPVKEVNLLFNRYCFCIEYDLIPHTFRWEDFSSPWPPKPEPVSA